MNPIRFIRFTCYIYRKISLLQAFLYVFYIRFYARFLAVDDFISVRYMV